MNDPQFYRIIRTMQNVADGGFGYTATAGQLIRGHVLRLQQILQALADCLIQFQWDHLAFTLLYVEIWLR